MSTTIRIILIIISVLTFIYAIRKIRKSQMEIADTFFWIVLSAGLVALSIFPQIAIYFSRLLGIETVTNFIFIAIIFILILKLFLLSIEISQLKIKLRNMIQEYAISNSNENERKEQSITGEDGKLLK